MSQSSNALQPRSAVRAARRGQGIHRAGELLGVQYEFGLHVSELTPPEPDRSDPRHVPAPDAVGRWEWEGGRLLMEISTTD